MKHQIDNHAMHLPLLSTDAPQKNNTNKNDDHERPQMGPWSGIIGVDRVKSIVYAGLDAIVTCFALISSISGGRLSSFDVLVLGFANLVADGISMGFGDYVSSSAEKDMVEKERQLTRWEVAHNVGGSQLEDLLRKYQSLGMDYQDALTVVNVLAKYREVLVEEKMSMNKGMIAPDEAEKPWKNGLVTFFAFIVFGSAPLLSYIVLVPFTNSQTIKFLGACVLSALALGLLGVAKAKIAGQNSVISVISVFSTVLNGAIAASAAYLIGWILRNVAG
ncbi:hypothetical protein Sjap_004970 [Stephania japonica]|uniref:Vacuolar iron transporter n=1 Tax=Stephania japonica TaxID=461633 RepID=A0AAP0K5G5_9MAGN